MIELVRLPLERGSRYVYTHISDLICSKQELGTKHMYIWIFSDKLFEQLIRKDYTYKCKYIYIYTIGTNM